MKQIPNNKRKLQFNKKTIIHLNKQILMKQNGGIILTFMSAFTCGHPNCTGTSDTVDPSNILNCLSNEPDCNSKRR
jgi:hypothetical protein